MLHCTACCSGRRQVEGQISGRRLEDKETNRESAERVVVTARAATTTGPSGVLPLEEVNLSPAGWGREPAVLRIRASSCHRSTVLLVPLLRRLSMSHRYCRAMRARIFMGTCGDEGTNEWTTEEMFYDFILLSCGLVDS